MKWLLLIVAIVVIGIAVGLYLWARSQHPRAASEPRPAHRGEAPADEISANDASSNAARNGGAHAAEIPDESTDQEHREAQSR